MEGGNSTTVSDRSVRRKASVDSVKRICDLPDSILGHILSFLPTEKAVATHILSQRWKFLWTTTCNLDFHFPKFGHKATSDFVKFVNYVLLVHKAGDFNRFSLIWLGWPSKFQVNTWLGSALAKNLHELCVLVSGSCLQIQVLKNIFSCQGLGSLELDCEFCISPEIVVFLPRLEKLKLTSIYFQSKDDFRKLFSCCPVLKYLYIDMNIWKMVKHVNLAIEDGVWFKFEVSSTSLRHLEIYARGASRDQEYFRFSSVHLDAPLLECIKLHYQISRIFILQTCTCLVEADVRLSYLGSQCKDQNYCNSIVETIGTFGNARTLTLSAQVTQALSCGTTKLRTMFTKLTRLEVKIESRHWSSMQDFIELSDNLEVLTIEKDSSLRLKDHYNVSNWKTPNVIPKCLSNSLKTVSFKGYDGFRDEVEMIGYILKYGHVLEVLEMRFGEHLDGFESKFMALQKILKFPRKSPVCEVELHDGLKRELP